MLYIYIYNSFLCWFSNSLRESAIQTDTDVFECCIVPQSWGCSDLPLLCDSSMNAVTFSWHKAFSTVVMGLGWKLIVSFFNFMFCIFCRQSWMPNIELLALCARPLMADFSYTTLHISPVSEYLNFSYLPICMTMGLYHLPFVLPWW